MSVVVGVRVVVGVAAVGFGVAKEAEVGVVEVGVVKVGVVFLGVNHPVGMIS